MKALTRIWIKKSVRDIFRQKLLFSALLMLCFLGIGSYIALTMGYTNLSHTYQGFYSRTRFADAELFTYEGTWFNLSLVQAKVDEFRSKTPEVERVDFRLLVKVGHNLNHSSSREGIDRNYYNEGRLVGIDWDTDSRVNDLFFEAGSFFDKTTENTSVLIEAHYAHHFDLEVGESQVTLISGKNYNFTIRGIVYSPEYLLLIPSRYDFLPTHRFGVGFLPLEHLQGYSNLTGLANNIIVKLRDGTSLNDRNRIINALTSTLNQFTSNSFTPPIFQEWQISNWALQLDLAEIREIALILPTVILGVAGVSIYLTLGRIVQSQKRSIGIAASLGYLPNDILIHYGLLVLFIGVVGSFSGVIAGILISGVVTWIYSYYMGFGLLIVIVPEFSVILIGIGTGIGVSVVSGILPAYGASRMVPQEALQTNLNVESGKRSILERLLVINPLGLKLTIPLRNLTRRRLRTAATIVGLTASVMILVVALAFIDSIGMGVNRQFYQTSQYDIIVKYDGIGYADLGVKEDIAAITDLDQSILAVNPVLQIPSLIHFGDVEQEVLITAFNTTQPEVHNFQWSSMRDEMLNDSLVICSALATRFSIGLGSNISFDYPQIPSIDLAFYAASEVYSNAFFYVKPDLEKNETYHDLARIEALKFLEKVLSRSKERLSFSDAKKIPVAPANASVSGVSEEIWGGFIYTHIGILTSLMGLDIFRTSELNIDLTPYSQLIIKVEDPDNVAQLEFLRDEILEKLDNVRSIEFFYDYRSSLNIVMGVFNAVVGVFLILACLIAGTSVFTTIFINFQERKREIATMFSLGLSDGEFLMMMTLENIVQAIVGIIFGIPIGLWMASWLLDNVIRVFYFQILIHQTTWILLWGGLLLIVLVSQLPAIKHSIQMDLTEVAKELTT
ncbi:MAG: ABC transporter permease [Candidatus Heimdallarchaeota archaeon]